MAIATTATERVELHRWTRQDYHRMAVAALLRPDERTELVDGVIYTMSPHGAYHAMALLAVLEALRPLFPDLVLRPQLPLALGESSEPQPDIAVVAGDYRSYRKEHPTTALLVVEVADSSLRHDRLRKLPLYARAGVPDSWILDLAGEALEVYRDPAGGTYRARTVLRKGDRISPLSCPDADLAVADLLP